LVSCSGYHLNEGAYKTCFEVSLRQMYLTGTCASHVLFY
jgi:hypothetical protein